jgi:putative tryptophan/tyrosine transport system substrate-binding protein
MRRREFITLLAAVGAARPLAVRAQQQKMPVVGFVGVSGPDEYKQYIESFLQALEQLGFVEGRNLSIEYRWAAFQYERLFGLIEDLVKRRVNVIIAGGPPVALAAKAATSSVPVVFVSGDAAKLKLVDNFSRPGGNLTGVSVFTGAAIVGKRLQLLNDLVPKTSHVAILQSANDPNEPSASELANETHSIGQELFLFSAGTDPEIDQAFALAAQRHADAMLISEKPFFTVRRKLIVDAAARHKMPTIYAWPEYVSEGGLISYGNSLVDAYRQVAGIVALIINGRSPSEIPVQQPVKFYLAVNLKTAQTLDLQIRPTLLAIADQVIE